jgi:hypothetical protein
MHAVLEGRDHNVLLLENKSGNAKRRRQWQLLDRNVQLQTRH